MSFQVMTTFYQDQLEELKKSPINEQVMEEIKDILSDYCFDVEAKYGVAMSFKVWVGETGVGLKYEVVPDSNLDAVLLKYVVENESQVGTVVNTIQ